VLLVFGSINVDLLFKLETLPRPGETVLCPGYELAAGGKGANQAAAAARAGAAVRMVGQVGDDSFGHFARQAMAAAGVDGTGIAISRRPTGVAVIGVDQRAENQIMVASGANLDTRANQVAERELAPGVTVLCQNEVRPEATFELLERAKARGARTILNLAPAGPVQARVLEALDYLVVNEVEGRMAAGGADGADVAAFARDLALRHDLTCVVTRGAEGALAIGPRVAQQVAALPVEPVDTTGAGDAFVGVPCCVARPGPRARRGIAARQRRGGPRLHQAGRADQPADRGRDRGAPAGAGGPGRAALSARRAQPPRHYWTGTAARNRGRQAVTGVGRAVRLRLDHRPPVCPTPDFAASAVALRGVGACAYIRRHEPAAA
jgi:ribokinase